MCSGKMAVFGQKWLYSGKVVLLGHCSCNRAKVALFGQSGCSQAQNSFIRAKWLFLYKMVVFGKNRLYSGKGVVFVQMWM